MRILPASLSLVLAVTLLGLAPQSALAGPGVHRPDPRPDPGLVGPVERGDPGDPGETGAAGRGALARRSDAIVLRGRGHGHGHGLSQYGAKGAAQRGWSYRRIVGFYYPRTTWSTARGRVQVLITADTNPDLVVDDRRGLRARAVGGSWVPLHDARPRAARWRITPDGARSVVSSRTTRGRWKRLRSFAGEAELSAAGRPVRLRTPGGATTYAGRLRSVVPPRGSRDGRGDRDTVNVVSLEAYLRGVVPLEVPALWPREAVRAQAVAARSYAAWGRAHPLNSHYQLLDTNGSQVYGGTAAAHPASDAAIRATRGEARFHRGRAAFTQFSASNGGWTAAGGFRYLPAKRDRLEVGSGNPYATWRRTLSRRAVAATYGVGSLRGLDLRARTGDGQWDGRVGTVRVRGSRRTVTVSGEDFRFRFGLPSTWFTQA